MDNKIDLNQADRDTLAGLPGVGEKLADRIIEYRESVQPFSTVAELAEVPGISENMVREIEDQVTVAAAPEADAEELVKEPPIEEAAVASAAIVAAVEERGDEDQLTGAAAPEADAEELVKEPPIEEAVVASAAIVAAVEERGDEDQLTGGAVLEVAPEDNMEEETVTTPEQPAVSPLPPPTQSGYKGHLFAAMIGAMIGTVLTLAILWLVNGSLQLNERAQISAFEQRSAQAAATTESVQAGVRADLQALSTQVSVMTNSDSEMTAALATAQSGLKTARDTLDDTVNEVATLEMTAEDLDERISAVAASAENFDAFLVGMRDLLWVLQGAPPTPEATSTSPAPTMTATAVATPTKDATATLTPFATRTPRPTATALGGALPRATATD